MQQEKVSEIDEKTYIEYIRGSYSEKLELCGEYKHLKNEFKKVSENKIALGILPFIFCELWFIKRRMFLLGFIILLSSDFLIFHVYCCIENILIENIYILLSLYLFKRIAFLFFAKKLHYNFLLKKKDFVKKGPAWGVVFVLAIIGAPLLFLYLTGVLYLLLY